MKEEVDKLKEAIIASGKCCMCNDPLPEDNTTEVACKDCTEYAFEAVGLSRGPNERN